jgi:hypothetical protein
MAAATVLLLQYKNKFPDLQYVTFLRTEWTNLHET